MYNRYIPNGTAYTRVSEEDAPPFRGGQASGGGQGPGQPPPSGQNRCPPPPGGPAKEGKAASWLSGLLRSFKLDDLDTGDILLLLIVLFLFVDGDDLELIITLGLLLLLGLGGKSEKDPAP